MRSYLGPAIEPHRVAEDVEVKLVSTVDGLGLVDELGVQFNLLGELGVQALLTA